MILRLDNSLESIKTGYASRHLRLPRGWIILAILWLPMALAAEMVTHTVAAKETLYGISRKYGLTVEQLKEQNGLTDNTLHIGQVLKIKEQDPPLPAAEPPAVPPTSVSIQAAIPPPPIVSEPVPAMDGSGMELPDKYYFEVQKQDNLYRIALNNNVKLADMLIWNGFADEKQVIRPGDRVIVRNPAEFAETDENAIEPVVTAEAPTESGEPVPVVVEKVYFVQKKDTLFSIAKANGITVDELKAMNNLESNDIKIGQKLYLAGGPPSGEVKTSGRSLTDEEIQKSDKIRSDLIMPVAGKVTSEFGIRNGRPHKGIDLGAKSGTPIYAALDGVVVYSGVQGGYGNVVVIEHPDFVMTVYAHNELNVVKVNDTVKQGQLIGYVGSTGNSTGPHLHFEYRLKGKAINPRKVLPF